jgi:chromosome segregation protein
MRKVHDDIASLMAAEARKQQLDQQVLDAKTRATSKLHEVEEHIAQLRKSYAVEYETSKRELDDDQQKLMHSQKYLDRIKEQETILQKKLDEIKIVSQSIAKEADERGKMITSTQEHMHVLKLKHEKLRTELEKEHQNLTHMIQLNEEQENHLKKTQKELFARIEENEKSLQQKQAEIKTLPQKFKELIEHRSEIHDIISQISSREVELKAEVERLQHQAHTLSMSMQPAEIELELERMHKKLSDIASMRAFFKEKVVRLTQLLDLKGVL